MRKLLGGIAIASLLLSFAPLTAHAATPKPGALCPKLNQTQISNGVKYSCVKSGKKLVWNKGVVIAKPAPAPVVIPSAQPTQAAQPTQPPTPVCGNGTCETGETSQTCAKDCGPAKPICGDGICDPNLETSQTCPKDCGTPPATACKSKADCATDEVCCIQAAGQVCVKIGTCK